MAQGSTVMYAFWKLSDKQTKWNKFSMHRFGLECVCVCVCDMDTNNILNSLWNFSKFKIQWWITTRKYKVCMCVCVYFGRIAFCILDLMPFGAYNTTILHNICILFT